MDNAQFFLFKFSKVYSDIDQIKNEMCEQKKSTLIRSWFNTSLYEGYGFLNVASTKSSYASVLPKCMMHIFWLVDALESFSLSWIKSLIPFWL